MNNVRLFSTPAKIYIGCFIGFFLFLIVGIPVVSITYSDGEQLPFALLRYTGDFMLLAFFILSIATSLMFREWFRIYWILNLVIMGLTGYLLVSTYIFPLLSDNVQM